MEVAVRSGETAKTSFEWRCGSVYKERLLRIDRYFSFSLLVGSCFEYHGRPVKQQAMNYCSFSFSGDCIRGVAKGSEGLV